MSTCGLGVGRWVLVLCIALTLTACGNSITTVSGIETSSKPHLVIEPQSGTQDTRIVITGRAFPPQQPVRLMLEWTGQKLDIGEVNTDGSGAFMLEYVLSKEITERSIVATDFDITATTVGNTTYASARYRYAPDSATTVSREIPSTSTPEDRQLDVRPSLALDPASGATKSRIVVKVTNFPPYSPLQIRVGVPGSGLVTQVLATAQTDANGNAQVYLEIPEFWEDGNLVVEPQLVVLVNAQDNRSNASATYDHILQPAVTDAASITATANDVVNATPSVQVATVEATT